MRRHETLDRLRKVNFQGMPIVIESPAGSLRHGRDWSQLMKNHYGFIAGTKAIDGDEMDCFLGYSLLAPSAFIVEQNKPASNVFDEFKVMLGFDSKEQAEAAYFANYEPGWTGFKRIFEVPLNRFDTWYESTL